MIMELEDLEIEILSDGDHIELDFKIFDIEINDPISEEDLRLEYLEKLVLGPKKE
jgi:hypothetical protein